MKRFTVITEHPVALDSLDHTAPAGTMHDNSRNPNFNRKLYCLIAKRPIVAMDLGCSGGGYVKDLIDDGHLAVGLEGSDYSTLWDGPGGTAEEKARRKPGKRAEWATIPECLFTADVTRPFTVLLDGERAKFDCITAWEMMEHIAQEKLPALCENVRRHLAQNGIWVMSVSKQTGEHHVCVHDRPWWAELFAREGFVQDEQTLGQFSPHDWVRGPLQKAPESFHFVLRVRNANGGE